VTRIRIGVFGVAVAVLVAVWLAVPRAARPAAPVVAPSAGVRTIAGDSPYDRAIDAAHRAGLRVWIETDLVRRWLQGPDSFKAAVAMVAEEATHKGVAGIKIADELGYHDGLDTPAKIRAFLDASASALRVAAPGKPLLVDMIVPELGCLPGFQLAIRWAVICAAHARGSYPQLALSEVDSYLASRDVDVLDLSTGLLPDTTYTGWGVDIATAQRTAWQEVSRRGWADYVTLQARKALAHPGADRDSRADVDAQLATFVDIPLGQGATAVDVWTWRQLYEGDMYRLMDPGLRSNALWQALIARHAAGHRLFTHLSPNSVEVGLDIDLRTLARVFTDVLIAAGTG
jgi:hypothetical protein